MRSYATAHSLGVMGIDNEVENETVGRAISSEQRQIMDDFTLGWPKSQ